MSFDDFVDRGNTYSLKWEKYAGKDVLPVWVADMDFRCPTPILKALKDRVDHGILGYHQPAQYAPANQAVQRWLRDKHDWHIELDWIVWNPGVVPAFNVACKAFAKAGENAVIQSPNYPPLRAAPKLNQLGRVEVPCVPVDNGGRIRWSIDFEVLTQKVKDPNTTLMILCNPMNPVGTVMTEAEVTRVANLCADHGVMLCSDEIHCDLVLEPGAKHVPVGKVMPESSVTLMAASKTFNIAGLGTSFAIIPNPDLRKRFVNAAMGIVPWANVLGLVGTEIAFTQCDEWHCELLDYLRANRDYLAGAIADIDGLSLVLPEATCLAWVDASGLGVDDTQGYFEAKGVGPSPGIDFGDRHYARINYGCPRSLLERVVERLKG